MPSCRITVCDRDARAHRRRVSRNHRARGGAPTSATHGGSATRQVGSNSLRSVLASPRPIRFSRATLRRRSRHSRSGASSSIRSAGCPLSHAGARNTWGLGTESRHPGGASRGVEAPPGRGGTSSTQTIRAETRLKPIRDHERRQESQAPPKPRLHIATPEHATGGLRDDPRGAQFDFTHQCQHSRA